MKRIEVSLSLAAVEPLLDYVEPLLRGLDAQPALDFQQVDSDEDMTEMWRAELLHGQVSDCGILREVFGSDFRESGKIEIDEENADAILRAAAAVRLRLRDTGLKRVTDEDLESGDVDFDRLGESEKLAFASYLFFATIQELVIKHFFP
jgi:hypothetical protein